APPNIKWTKNTNSVFISASSNPEFGVVFVAIDNLIKGGAGQAVQCMNIACGFSEELGLPICGEVV
ncbi:MAG: N-acetyl-gamma-glutamyl-phosphate reductase, partial [Planctomycetes bacterium]|nr:N-acetyl-gamma-glutamyl-phosphate reductase [Planctomycetota bacterium]